MLKRIVARRLPATGHRVAVAGSGPTGLTAAFYLAMLGHDVTIFEERDEAGGMLRYAIPEYRLPKWMLRRELDLIEGVGVKMEFGVRVGIDLPLNELATRFDAVFLSIGTWKESWLYLPGTELKGRSSGAAVSGVGGQTGEGGDGLARDGDRRRQCGD